jgi:hypothetical protein
MGKILLVNCPQYVEDQCVCDDDGEPKGQCAVCGAKWYEHPLWHFEYGSDDYTSAEDHQLIFGTI